MMKIWQGATLSPFLLVLLLLGCQREDQGNQNLPDLPIQQTIRVEWRSSEAKKAFEPWATRESSRSGIRIVAAESGQADVVIGHPWDLVSEAEKDQLAELPQELSLSRNSLRFDDFLPWIRQRFLVWNQKNLSLPLLGDGWVVVVRKDWLAQAAKKLGKPVPLTIDSWDDFLKVAEMLSQAGMGSPAGKVIAANGSSAHQWEEEFLWIHASHWSRALGLEEKKENLSDNELFAYLYDVTSGEFRPGKKATQEAVRIWRAMAPLRTQSSANKSPIEDFLAGNSGLGLFPLSVCAQLPGSGLEDKVEIFQVPGATAYENSKGEWVKATRPNRRPLLGGRLILGMVRKDSPNQDVAWKFLTSLAMPMGERWALAKDSAGVTRTDQVLRMRWDRFDLDPKATLGLRELLREQALHAKVQNPAMYPRRPDSPQRAEILQKLLQSDPAALTGESFDLRWKEKLDALGPTQPAEKRRMARLSAGLIP